MKLSINLKDIIITELHNVAGVCAHCGEKDCASKLSNSKLLAYIDTDNILTAIDRAVEKITKE